MRPSRAIALAFVALGLAAFRYPTDIAVPAPAVAPSFSLTDARPKDQSESEFESLMITNCAYGSVRVGGADLSPDPLTLVRDGLAARANAALAGKQVVLSNLTIHVNNAQGLRATVGNMYTGVIPDLMNKRDKVGCAHDDLRGGYTLGEVDGAPLITVIDVTVDGQEHHARCIVPSPSGPPLKRHKPEIHAAWNKAASEQVGCALDMLAAQINAGTVVAFARAEERADEAREDRQRAWYCKKQKERGHPCKKSPAAEAPGVAEATAAPTQAAAPAAPAEAPAAPAETAPGPAEETASPPPQDAESVPDGGEAGPGAGQVAQDHELPA
jgi:hypothetical protein